MKKSCKSYLLLLVFLLFVTKTLSNQKYGHRLSVEEVMMKAFTSQREAIVPKKTHEKDIIFKHTSQFRMRRFAQQPVLRRLQVNYAKNNYDHSDLFPMPRNLDSSLIDRTMTYQSNNSLPNSLQKIRVRGNRQMDLNPNEGRLEIFQNNRWGLICDDYWRDTDANVACRQLGFSRGASRVHRGARYGVDGIPVDGAITGYMSCTGSEKSLQKCSQVVKPLSCRVGDTASLQCIYNDGCATGWTSFHGLCYRVDNEAVNFETARQRCSANGAHLISILSLEENNFISDILATKFKNITSVWTSGMFGYYWQNDIGFESWAWRDTVHNIDPGSSFEAWFPGFKSSNGSLDKEAQRPSKPLNKRSCLALNSIYRLGNKFVDTQYFWWENVACKQRMPFICQKVASSSDCYNKANNGRDYVGNVRRTEFGSPCKPWSTNIAGNLTPLDNKDLTTDENFCRNPDHDIKPWCWVDSINFVYGYCEIQECSSTSQPSVRQSKSFETAGYGKGPCGPNSFYCPSMAAYSEQRCINSRRVCDGISDCFMEDEDENEDLCRLQCSSQEFYCVEEKRCVPNSMVCDGIPNCSDGSDEFDCSNKDVSAILNSEFSLRENVKATLQSANSRKKLVYFNLNVTHCALKCNTPKINYNEVCYGFNYIVNAAYSVQQYESTCELIFVPESQIQFTENSDSRWYASKSVKYCDEASGEKFRCSNERCINIDLKCNSFDDCGDFSDENNCAYSTTVAPPTISLVNNIQRGGAEGRIEITYRGETGMLCDNDFTLNDGHVICRQLGFPKALRIIANAGQVYGRGNNQFLLERLQCTGSESGFSQCPRLEWKNNRCTAARNVAGLICAENRGCRIDEFRCDDGPGKRFCIPLTMVCDNKSDCFSNADEKSCNSVDIKLTGGPDSNSGIVEIVRNGVLGTICNKQFSIESAQVVCRQLGIPGEARLVVSSRMSGRGVIWLENVRCAGPETKISDCLHSGWGISTICDHRDDVIIECGLKSTTTTVVPTSTTRAQPNVKKTAEQICGQRPILGVKQQARVLGGYNVTRGSFPWQVGIRKKFKRLSYTETKAHCGGTILNEFWIMTAAHCFPSYEGLDKYEIRVGDHNNVVEDPEEQVFQIQLLIKHEQYSGAPTYNYDAALLKIVPDQSGKGIRFSNGVQPACLPSSQMNTDQIRKPCQASGWGRLEDYRFPKVLQAAEIPILLRDECNRLYPTGFTEMMICAGYTDVVIDTCQGDSGGPLVCNIEGKYTLIGATSWGNGCGEQDNPGIYVNIPRLVDWIEGKIEENS